MKLETMPLRFRVWDKEEKRFIAFDENYCFARDEDNNLCVCDIDWYSKDLVEMDRDRFIISQDTGLTDNNGVMVFSGDIIRDIDDEYLSVVKYIDGKYVGVDPESNNTIDCLYLIARDGEVIGNIWQSPELLENNDGKR